MGIYENLSEVCAVRSANAPEWYYENFSRPVFQHVCTDRALYQLLLSEQRELFMEHTGRVYQPRKNVMKAMGFIILDLYVRYRTTGGQGNIGVFTSNGAQTEIDSRQYKKLGVLGGPIGQIREMLTSQEFIQYKQGVKGHSTKIKAMPEFIRYLESRGLSMDKIRSRRVWPVVWSPVKDESSDETPINTRVPRPLAEEKGLKDLFELNSILQKSDIRVGSLPLYSFEKQCRRIFKDPDCTSYGRIHGGIWQNLPGKARSLITINGQGTVEVDISSTHPLIAYALGGYDLTEIMVTEGKPYDLSFFPDCTHTLELSSAGTTDREILKRGVMNCFNNETQRKAQQALQCEINTHKDIYTGRNHWLPRYRQLRGQGVTSPGLVEAISQKHHRIRDWFFQQGSDTGWLRLNIWESQIALKVIQYFNTLGVPVLPIHDSFIVPFDKQEELESVIVSSIEDVLGTSFTNKERLYGIKPPAGITRLGAEHMLTQTRIRRDRYEYKHKGYS